MAGVKRRNESEEIGSELDPIVPPETSLALSPGAGELGKYAKLCDELQDRLAELELLHEQRSGFQVQALTFKALRTELQHRLLDGDNEDPALIREIGLLEDSNRLNMMRLEAIEPRIERMLKTLQERVPLAIGTFGQLRSYVCASVLEVCRSHVRSLVELSLVDASHIDAIALAMPDYLKVSRIKLPTAGWTLTRDLDAVPTPWSALAKPYSAQELAELRAETVKSLTSATNELCRAARALLEAARPYAEGCPPFKCEAEVILPAQPDPEHLEWLQPLGGSDEEWAKQICKQAGKPYPPTSAGDIEILANLLIERHKHPISHGIVTAEMVGSTYVE